MQGSIVCGVDGSTESRFALRVAAHLSGQLGLRLILAHVAQAETSASPYQANAAVTRPPVKDLRASRELLEQIALGEGLGDATLRSLIGLPAEQLADLGDEADAAFIVVGSRGRGAFKAAFLGSVSRDLIGIARCPVLVVPPGAAANAY
jgi:nucleotide-binding universal stress UspA family protein